MRKEKIENIWNYFLTYMMIAFTDIPFFDYFYILKMIFFIFLFFLFLVNHKKLDVSIIIITFLFWIILIIQNVIWGGRFFSFFAFTGVTILTPYFFIKLIGPQIFKFYRNIIFGYSFLSIFLWIGSNLSESFHQIFYKIALKLMPYTNFKYPVSAIIYSYKTDREYGIIRNPGPFHEPGAFALLLIIALLFELIENNKLFTFKNMIFIISILSTFSTLGYLSLLTIISFYLIKNKKSMLYRYFIFLFIIFLIYFLYGDLNFLGKKIKHHFNYETSNSLSTATSGRIVGARKALIVLSRYPIWGRGLLKDTRPESTSEEAAGYGWIYWISQIGLPLGLFYLFSIVKTLNNFKIANNLQKDYALYSSFAFLIVLAGQKHSSSNLVFALFLMSYIYPLKRYKNLYKITKEN